MDQSAVPTAAPTTLFGLVIPGGSTTELPVAVVYAVILASSLVIVKAAAAWDHRLRGGMTVVGSHQTP